VAVFTGIAGNAAALPPPPAGVQVTTSYGIEFSTISSAGNAAHPPPGPFILNTQYPYAYGSVGYDFRVARTEITTGQWLQFYNTFSTQAGFPSQLFGQPSFVAEPPIDWAASPDPAYSGPGVRYRVNPVPNAADFPVRGISWRDAALYCNWLCNGQSSSQSALWSGAYDTSTFGVRTVNGFGEFTDQVTRSPGAQYWIPSYDE
jgi:hypothetical protein